MLVSREHIDYLQRSDRSPEPIPQLTSDAEVPIELRCLSRIRTIGMDRSKPRSDDAMQMPSSDLSISLYAATISIAYLVLGRGDTVEVYLGNWQRGVPDATLTDVMYARQDIIVSGLKSLYPASNLEPLNPDAMQEVMTHLSELQTSGFVLGLPTIKPAPWDKNSYPLDRVIRSLRGSNWACVLLAEPVGESLVNKERDAVIEELKDIPDVNRSSIDETQQQRHEKQQQPNVLGAYYRELLTLRLQTLSSCLGAGAWRTALYLLGDTSYYRLASVWRGVFSGDDALLEPVRVWHKDVGKLVAKWAMSNIAARVGPGRVRRLLEHQTILSSAQLAAYLHLPRVETNGFTIKQIASFGSAPRSLHSGEEGLSIGKVLSRENLARDYSSKDDFEQLPNTRYYVRPDALTKHVFVAGVTGSGKTTTIFHLLKEAFALGVPFLVVEPAKTEYRELLNHKEIGKKLQIYTLADEQVSPLRINPFEVLLGTSISKHIDLLRSLFSGSFGLWTPLPQILEECLYLMYQDKGWDLTNDSNSRLSSRTNDRDDPTAFPTLGDLLVKVDEVTSRLQWDTEATARIRGSLRDRLRSLRNGGRGRMLDVQSSLPMQVLLGHPTVIELEGMGDDDDKAFMMGLLLIRLVEYRRSPQDKSHPGPQRALRHLLVFEEAHRLLANAPFKGAEGAANPRAKTVEMFANLLSEIRSYGQGVIVADQVPVKLSPDVIKNTNLKIAHRVVDLEDRKMLGGAMVMTDEQVDALAKLLPGTAAVYSEGDDAPLLLQMSPGPDPKPPKPSDDEIKAHRDSSEVLRPYEAILPRHPACSDTGKKGGAACDAARLLVESPLFQRDFTRLVLSMIDDSSALERLWPPIESYVNASINRTFKRGTMMQCVISRAAEWYAFRRGSQGSWQYPQTREIAEKLHNVLLLRNDPTLRNDSTRIHAAIQSLRDSLLDLHRREFLPYPGCGRICDQEPASCLYRQAVRDIVVKGDFNQQWRKADPANAGEKTGPQFAWEVCQRVAEQLVEWKDVQRDAIQRIGLCYGQMMLSDDAFLMTPEGRGQVFEGLFKERANVTLASS
jgi:hypothetical protein